LIIKAPNTNKGQVIDYLAEQIDITPTILEILKIPVPKWMEGRSLLPLLQGESLLPKLAFSMALGSNPSKGHEIKRGTIAVWQDDYKLIHYLDNKKSLLFNLNDDPDELNNLFNEQSNIGNSLLAVIRDNLASANHRIKGQ
jgi:arylsulfatase A-like enzyme